MGDVLDTVVDVVANVATGGLYSLVKAGVETVKTGNPSALLTQGLDIGMASTGNAMAKDLGGDNAAMAFNAAGGALGAAGASGAFSALPGFAGEAAPLAGAEALTAGAPVAEGAAPIAPGVEMGVPGSANYAGLDGALGETVAPTAARTGMIGASESSVPSLSSGINPEAIAGDTGNMMHGTGSLADAAKTLETAGSTQSWWASQPDAVKAALMGGGIFAGGQLVTGGLGGLFQGLSAQKKLELEQLINQQSQNQRQYLNANQTYAPKLKFKPPTGMIAKGA